MRMQQWVLNSADPELTARFVKNVRAAWLFQCMSGLFLNTILRLCVSNVPRLFRGWCTLEVPPILLPAVSVSCEHVRTLFSSRVPGGLLYIFHLRSFRAPKYYQIWISELDGVLDYHHTDSGYQEVIWPRPWAMPYECVSNASWWGYTILEGVASRITGTDVTPITTYHPTPCNLVSSPVDCHSPAPLPLSSLSGAPCHLLSTCLRIGDPNFTALPQTIS